MENDNGQQHQVINYQPAKGDPIPVRIDTRSIWVSRKDMARGFGRDVRTIERHWEGVLADGELEPAAVTTKFVATASDGKTYEIEHGNFEMLCAIGYRVKSKEGIAFRRFATQCMRERIEARAADVAPGVVAALLDEVRSMRREQSEIRSAFANLGPEITQKLLVETPGVIRAVLVDVQHEMQSKGPEVLLRSKLGALFRAVTIARAQATGKSRRSGLRWLQNKLQANFGWGGKNQKIEDTPSHLLSFVIAFLQSELDDIKKSNPSAVDGMPPAPTPANDQTNMFFLPTKTPTKNRGQ